MPHIQVRYDWSIQPHRFPTTVCMWLGIPFAKSYSLSWYAAQACRIALFSTALGYTGDFRWRSFLDLALEFGSRWSFWWHPGRFPSWTGHLRCCFVALRTHHLLSWEFTPLPRTALTTNWLLMALSPGVEFAHREREKCLELFPQSTSNGPQNAQQRLLGTHWEAKALLTSVIIEPRFLRNTEKTNDPWNISSNETFFPLFGPFQFHVSGKMLSEVTGVLRLEYKTGDH